MPCARANRLNATLKMPEKTAAEIAGEASNRKKQQRTAVKQQKQ